MTSDELALILRCPETRQELERADDALLARVNAEAAAGALRNRAGEPVAAPLEGAWLRQDRRCLYPVRGGIPVLLAEEAIPLEAGA